MKTSGKADDMYDDTVSKSRPPLPPPPKPMTETTLQTITTQKGKFTEPSSSSTMEKYTYDEQFNLSLATTTTTTKKAIKMESNLPAWVNFASSSKQLASQPPKIELPGDYMKLPANVVLPKHNYNNPIINLDDGGDSAIEDVKRLKLDSSNTYAQLNKRVEKTTKLFDVVVKSTVSSSRGGRGMMRKSDAEGVVPSAEALALMGRALNGARPCERQTKGAVTFWKT